MTESRAHVQLGPQPGKCCKMLSNQLSQRKRKIWEEQVPRRTTLSCLGAATHGRANPALTASTCWQLRLSSKTHVGGGRCNFVGYNKMTVNGMIIYLKPQFIKLVKQLLVVNQSLVEQLLWSWKTEVQIAKAHVLEEALKALWVHVTGVLRQKGEDKTISGPLSRPKGNIDLKLSCLFFFSLLFHIPSQLLQHVLPHRVHPQILWVSTQCIELETLPAISLLLLKASLIYSLL